MTARLFATFYRERRDKILFGLILGSFLIALLSQFISPTSDTVEAPRFEPDTHIPADFTMVTIQLANREAIDTLIGPFAVVDLYTEPSEGQRHGRLVGKNLKLIRAPLDPMQFAVLVPNLDSHRFSNSDQRYFATIKNRNSNIPSQISGKPKQQKIEFFRGSE